MLIVISHNLSKSLYDEFISGNIKIWLCLELVISQHWEVVKHDDVIKLKHFPRLPFVKLRSHMRGAVAERRRADFDIPAPLLRVCSHIRGADAGGSAISWGQRWFETRGFEADAEEWVLDPFVAERILLPLRLRSATAHVWTHVMICVGANFRPLPPASAPRMCEFTGHLWIPSQRPVKRSFDVYFDPQLNKRFSKQSRRRWFEMPSRSLWRHCNESFLVKDNGWPVYSAYVILCTDLAQAYDGRFQPSRN